MNALVAADGGQQLLRSSSPAPSPGDPARPSPLPPSETVGFSHSDFGLVVQALDDAAGKQFLSAEVIEDQLAVVTQ